MTSIDREAFEAWYKNNFGEPDFLRGACGTYYMNSSVDFAWQTWQAALAQANVNEQSQAQQESQAFKALKGMIELWFRTRESGCLPIEVAHAQFVLKTLLPQSQAQQSQWISVEERLPEGDVFVDVYIRSRSNTNFMQRETSVAFVSGKFKINRIFDCEYVSHWMVIPPAPVSANEQPEGGKP